MIRPDVAHTLTLWREALIGVTIFLVGVWLVGTVFGALYLIGWGLVILGAALIFTGTRRARRPADGGGLGVVEIDERQVTYLTPAGGGAVSLDRLTLARKMPGDDGRFHWHLADADGNRLIVPSDAEGAAVLEDAVAVLPGQRRDDASRVLSLRRPPH